MPRKAQGLSPEEQLATAFAAYQHATLAFAAEAASWDELGEDEQHAFGAAVKAVLDFFDGEPREGVRWADVAAHAHLAYQRTLLGGDVAEEWAALPLETRLVWEALARHLANMLDFDPSEDGEIGGHEGHWYGWCQEKFHTRQLAGGGES